MLERFDRWLKFESVHRWLDKDDSVRFLFLIVLVIAMNTFVGLAQLTHGWSLIGLFLIVVFTISRIRYIHKV